MSKIVKHGLSLALVLVLCVSLMSGLLVSAAEAGATITFDDKAKRTELSTEKQVWVENGITVTNNKGESKSNVGDYATPARFYKDSELVIAYPGMMQINIQCNSASYAETCKNSITDTNVTVSVSGKTVSIALPAAADSYTFLMSGGQVRVDSISVYTSHVEAGEPEGFDPTGKTPAEIVDGAYALAQGESMLAKATLTGKVTEIKEAYSEQWKNVGVIIAIEGKEDKPILCYRMKGDEAADVAVGDTITVTGTLTNYQGTIEFESNCTLDARVPAGPSNTGDFGLLAMAAMMAASACGVGVLTLKKKEF